MNTFGLIPAAGKSRRMGQPKLLLPLGDSTVLEHVLAAVRSAGVAEVLVVAAPEAQILAQLAASAGAHVLRLEADTPDMRTTCMHGLAWIEERFQPRDDDGWLLLPADHPTVHARVVEAVLKAAEENRDKSIIVPVHGGRRGHPTWLRWSHVASLRKMPPEQGFNTYIRAHAAETLELPWPDDEILRDLDTPEDYKALLQDSYCRLRLSARTAP